MKKVLKYVGIILGVIVVLVGGALLFINIRGIPTYEPKKIDLKVEATPARLEHGKRMVTMLCASCHMDPVSGKLVGKLMADAPPEFGVLYSRNITQHPEKGIGTWTDGELAYLLRTGIKRDGNYVPMMGGFIRMSDEDILSIIAFLRSNDPLVQPQAVDDKDSEYSLLAKVLGHFVFTPNEYPTKPIAPVPISDKVAYGKYLALGVLDCYTCHSADFKTMDTHVPEKSEGFFGGGNQMRDLNGNIMYTANITPDPETGIGKWSEAQFIRAIKHGFRPDNTPLRYPMEIIPELSDEEISALYAYLRTVPPINNKVPKSEVLTVADAATAPSGKAVYYKYSCYSCHGETGIGTCDLRDADTKYPHNDSLISWIRNPAQYKPDSKMPTWEGVIQENEYAPLAEYVRFLGKQPRQPEKPVAAK